MFEAFELENTRTVNIDGRQVEAIVGPVRQRLSKYDGVMRAVFSLCVKSADMDVITGERVEIDGVVWDVEPESDASGAIAVSEAGDLVQVTLSRYLA